jgi:hypothetical protein
MEYIDSVLIPYKLKHNFDKLYFIFDSAKCHTTPKVLNHLEKNNIEAIIVPPRFTNLIQPADVIRFSLLKGAYHGKNGLFQMTIRIQNIITCVLQVMLIV